MGLSPVVLSRAVLAAAALANGAGALVIARGPGQYTTYAGASVAAAVLTGAVVLTVVLAGVVTRGRSGTLLLLAAVAWTATVWAGWPSGPALVPSLAPVVAGFAFPLLIHVALRHPAGQLDVPRRAVVITAYTEAAAAALILAAVRDPYLDPDCWANCAVNSLLVTAMPRLAHAVEHADRWIVAATALSAIALLAVGLVTASAAARRILLPVTAPAAAYGLAVVARAAALQVLGAEDPLEPLLAATFLVGGAAVVGLGGGVGWARLRSRAQRLAVERIAVSLDELPPPGTLQANLARILHDPDLQIAYWLEDAAGYVGTDGVPVPEPTREAGRSTTQLLSGQRPIAVVTHATGALQDAGQLSRTMRLSLDNERLQAELRHRIAELRESRRRIVAAGDETRRRLERDLHDGAQQGLLALAYELKLALRAAGSPAERDALQRALAQAEAAIDDLRALAHGLYPAVLAEAGLSAALQSLADTAPIPMDVDGSGAGDDRASPEAEAAAYVAVRESVGSAALAGAAYADVRLARDPGRLVVRVRTDVAREASNAMLDRVGAVGGRVSVESDELVVEIPCG